MDLKGEQLIAAPREVVWAAINDPDVLRACIPGCTALEGDMDNGFSAVVVVKIGPIKATFSGTVALSDVDPPHSYRISGEGNGGIAGFAKGGADVALAAAGADTLLTYTVQTQIGGKIAQLGSRLIDATARKLAAAFFQNLAAHIANEPDRSVPSSA